MLGNATSTLLLRLLAALPTIALALGPAAATASDCPPGMQPIARGALRVGGRTVSVAPFCLDRTEVTVDAYASCTEIGVCPAEGLDCGNAAMWGKKGRGAYPMNCVTWFEADAFCRAHGKRLPTEAEWEWAARGEERGLTYPWGEEAPDDRACWDGQGNAVGKGERKEPCPVGANRRGVSQDGLQDLAGNVREWTSSREERFRVLRGGSWGDSLPEFLSTSFRGWNAPDERMEILGFRCATAIGAVARTPTPKPKAVAKREPGDVLVIDPFGVGTP